MYRHRPLSDAAALDCIEVEGPPWGLVPGTTLHGDGVYITETFEASREVAPGLWAAVEVERPICKLRFGNSLHRIVAARTHRGERGVVKRLQARWQREDQEKAKRGEDWQHSLKGDLRKVMKSRVSISMSGVRDAGNSDAN